MITSKQDRHLYIGGSEANMIYMNYSTKTFQDWWNNKLEGITDDSPPNIHMAVGTILEYDVIDLYESIHNIKGERDAQMVKGFARANMDLIIGKKVSDVKVTKSAEKWHEKVKVPIQYKRQLIHYLYVTGFKKASIIAYQCDDELKENPFLELEEKNLYEIDVPIKKEEIEKHHQIIEYLEFCKEMGIFPK